MLHFVTRDEDVVTLWELCCAHAVQGLCQASGPVPDQEIGEQAQGIADLAVAIADKIDAQRTAKFSVGVQGAFHLPTGPD